MKKYFIAYGLLAGCLVGFIIGTIINFVVPIITLAGAALGIIAGAAVQLVINQTYPDEYFKKKKREVDVSIFSEPDIAYREAYTASRVYRDERAVEDIDINDYLSDEEKQRQKKIRQEQIWKEQAKQAKIRQQQNIPPRDTLQQNTLPRKTQSGSAQRNNIFQETRSSNTRMQGKKRVIIEDDED